MAVRRYVRFAALRALAYVALAFLLVFYCVPKAAADDVAVDKSALEGAIDNANGLLGAYPVYDSPESDVDQGVQYVTSDTHDVLASAVGAAQAVYDDAAATQDAVNAQVSALDSATATFNAGVLVGAKAEVPPDNPPPDNPPPDNPPPDNPPPDNPPSGGSQPSPTIDGVGIYIKDTDDCLGTNLGDYTQLYDEVRDKARITQKGGFLELDYVVRWNNGDTSARNDGNATWWSSDTSVASFNSNKLEPHKNGTVRIRAIASSDKAGGELYAEATIQIAGQDDALYIESIRIVSPAGQDITGGLYVMEENLSTAQAQFMAEVDVVDPAAGTTTTVSTNGELSKQIPELGDLVWAVGDPALASVMEHTGQFRPSRYAMVAVMVSSLAGFGGASVSASTVVSTINPDEGEQGDEYHPQESLTVMAYYELQPPSEYGEDAYVINRTYSLGDLQGLGALTGYYTAFSSSGDYYTMQGTGVPLSSVLRESGINLDGIKHFAFRTADWPSGENRPVTASFVFADRYFYPNIDIGSFADAEQVFPILAWSSSQIRNSTNMDIPMTEATRFRLLFGATPDGGNSQYQIKWINTIVVVLSGGPPVDPGNGGEGGGGDGESSAGSGDGDGKSNAEGDGANSSGSAAPAAGSVDSGNTGGTTSHGGSDSSQDSVQESTQASIGVDSQTTSGVDGNTGGTEYRVYQVMNKNASNTDTILHIDNPLAPYTVPLGVAVVGIGGLESLLWFRFQRQGALSVAKATVAS